MVTQTYPWQQVQPTQPQQVQQAQTGFTPFFPQPAPPAAPAQRVRQHSVTSLLRDAETIVPTLQPAHFALLHGVAVLMLLHPGTGYRPTPNEAQNAHLLAQGNVLAVHNGGYVLTDLGHAVLATLEADAIS